MTSPFTDEQLKTIGRRVFTGSESVTNTLVELARELLEARRDAKRYRHLRNHWVSFYSTSQASPPDLPTWHNHDALDNEIDAALREGK